MTADIVLLLMEILSEEPTEDQKPNRHTTARAISTGVEPAKLNPPPFETVAGILRSL